jgi:hypothetical protein
MELRLEQLIDNLEFLSDITNQSEDTPIVMRHTDPGTNRTIAIVCSQVEPINMVLPVNVIWICYKPESPLYRLALKRTSKEPGNMQADGVTQTWEVLYFYEELLEAQVYDPEDLTLLGVGSVPFANTTVYGKVRLSRDPLDPDQPVAIVTDDPRMSDNRDPTAHTHPERPATMLRHSQGHSVIQNSTPAIGQVLLHDAQGDLRWGPLEEENLT